jgi:hypothetical protein
MSLCQKKYDGGSSPRTSTLPTTVTRGQHPKEDVNKN